MTRFDARQLGEAGDRRRYLAVYQRLQHAGFDPRVEQRNAGLMLVANCGRCDPTDLYFFSDLWNYDRLAAVLEAFARDEGLE